MNTGNTLSWIDALQSMRDQGQDYVLVTVLGARGSTPRDNGSKMVIARDTSVGTIGGGHLEYKAMQLAADLLNQQDECQRIEYFPLGPALGQCCGGSTSVLFESFKGSRLNIVLFGAGHVGSALSGILEKLPCTIQWVDSRENFQATSPAPNVRPIYSERPADEVASMPANSCYIIMTHNHQQDYEILEAVLQRDDVRYVGLIGSDTKWRRFQLRLQHRGMTAEDYQQVRCPIGLSNVPGKLPIEIAVAVAGEIIALQHQDQPVASTQRGLSRAELQHASTELASPVISPLKSTDLETTDS